MFINANGTPTDEMGGIQQYCLRWNNHRSNLLLVFEHLFLTESFTDVTLACDGSSIKCHKMVLAACSSYFQQLLMENDCRHPIVILKDIKLTEMKAILEYMYKGEVNVAQDQLAGLLKAAETLKVKGLVEDKPNMSTGGSATTPAPPTRTPPTRTPPTRTPTTPTPPTPGAEQNQSPYQPPSKNSTPFHMWSYSLPLAPSPKQIHHGSNNNYENSQNQPVNFTNKLEGNKDTPILRTVLGHTLQYQNSLDSQPTNNQHRERLTSDSIHMENDKVNEENSSLSTEEAKSGEGLTLEGIATYVPEQKPEWKRYKQYTRNDIMAAIEAVKTGMSALQAARKYGVPSRTLYDKVKKLGINTNRPYRKGSFPMSPYQGISIKGEEALNYVKSEDDTSYSPADISLDISYTGNGTEMDSDRMDSDAACSVKQEHSPPMDDEKDASMDDEMKEDVDRTNHVTHHKPHIENGSSSVVNQSLLI